jgi:hypothetical protein
VPCGRVYAFYNHNTDNVREVKREDGGVCRRVDSLGHYVFRYSNDHGRSWSASRYPVPVREFECDRNPADRQQCGCVQFNPGHQPDPAARPSQITTQPGFVDQAVSDGIEYFHVVTASNRFGESPPSAEVMVVPGNRPPVAVDDEATTLEDTPVVIDVLGNDSDPDGDDNHTGQPMTSARQADLPVAGCGTTASGLCADEIGSALSVVQLSRFEI